MKKQLIFFFIVSIIFNSCNKSNESIEENSENILENPNESIEENSENILENILENPNENISLDPNLVSQSISIQNSSKHTGNPPLTNSDIDFNLFKTKQIALQNIGFEINLQTNSNYAGAYFQVKGSNEYFKITSNLKSAKTTHNNNITITLSLSNIITTGTFCYNICVFDNLGNISRIEEVCVEVESIETTIDSPLIGNWIATDYISKPDSRTSFKYGTEICPIEEKITLKCNNNTQISVDDACRISREELIFESGKATINSVISEKWLNSTASIENCKPVYSEYRDEVYNNINDWYFIEESQEIILVRKKSTFENRYKAFLTRDNILSLTRYTIFFGEESLHETIKYIKQ